MWVCRGPSPRARGSRTPPRRRGRAPRSIPACAGLTAVASGVGMSAPVHPRVRGAHRPSSCPEPYTTGPSPRARGSLAHGRLEHVRERSIPACAGLTCLAGGPSVDQPVHPRVRGAHVKLVLDRHRGSGPSPRARGSPPGRAGGLRARRSIPACAGLTGSHPAGTAATAVHPRVRGAHRSPSWGPGTSSGPSPRARGSRVLLVLGEGDVRSIPACAGLTSYRAHGKSSNAVHPRVRGAHSRSSSACCSAAVHPRVRGAHSALTRAASRATGPSPRARGSRLTTWEDAGRYLPAI